MKKRAAALLAVGLACGASRTAPKKPPETTLVPDAGTAWEGEGCITLPSRSTPLDVPNVVFDGDLHKGVHHCYLDLQQALCVRFPAEDGGTGELIVRTLRLPGNCDSLAEVRFRGSLHGVVEPLGRSIFDFTVDANATSLDRTSHVVEVAVSDASAARKELLDAFILHCWRNTTFTSPTVMGHLALDVVVAPSGEVGDMHRREAVAVPEAFERCVEKSLRVPQMFLATDAGASREISLRVDFSVAVAPMPPP